MINAMNGKAYINVTIKDKDYLEEHINRIPNIASMQNLIGGESEVQNG